MPAKNREIIMALVNGEDHVNKEDGFFFSSLDIENFDNLSAEEIQLVIKKISESINLPEESIESAKIFLERSLKITLPAEVSIILKNTNLSDLSRSISSFSLSAQKHIIALLKVISTLQHLEDNSEVFNELEKEQISFHSDFFSLFNDDGNNRDGFFLTVPKDTGGTEKCYLAQQEEGYKTKDRIMMKLIRKAEEDFSTIGDLLRMRFILKTGSAANTAQEIITKIKAGSRGKKKIFTSVKIKNHNANITRDDSRTSFVVSGEYKNIPFEIETTEEQQHKENEKAEKHHKIYEFIQECFVIERLYGSIPANIVRERINELSNSREILSTEKDLSAKELKKRIFHRFDTSFFSIKNNTSIWVEGDGGIPSISQYISIPRIMRLRKTGIVKAIEKKDKALFLNLEKRFKQKAGNKNPSNINWEQFLEGNYQSLNNNNKELALQVLDDVKVLRNISDDIRSQISNTGVI